MSENVLDKVRNKVVEFYLKEQSKELPEHGSYSVNIGYDLATNSKHPDKIFVVYKKYFYKNHSIQDIRYCVMAFDAKTGNEIEGFQGSPACYDGFYNEAEFVSHII